MDKFVVKTVAVPWKEKTRSHLPVNLTAKDRAVKYPEGTFHEDDGLFCSSCNVVIDHLRKCVVDKHLEAASHKQNVEKNQRSNLAATNFDSLSANRLKINYRCDVFDF